MVVFSPKLELITLEVLFILNDSIVLLNPNFSVNAISISCSPFFLWSVSLFYSEKCKRRVGLSCPSYVVPGECPAAPENVVGLPLSHAWEGQEELLVLESWKTTTACTGFLVQAKIYQFTAK